MRKQIVIIVVGLLVGWFIFNKINNAVKKVTAPHGAAQLTKKTSAQKIDELTKEAVVVDYLKKNQKLPDYYFTKKEAMKLGWQPSSGNLCDVAKNKAIGGDVFTNRGKRLPTDKKRKWYEADLNYNCGRRGADRVVFSNDGLIYVTYNHYKTFQKK